MNRKFVNKYIKYRQRLRFSVPQFDSRVRTIGWGCKVDTLEFKKFILELVLPYEKIMSGKFDLTYMQVQHIFDRQVDRAVQNAYGVFGETLMDSIPDKAAAVVVDTIYNMGLDLFAQLDDFIEAVTAQEWGIAQRALMTSFWKKEDEARCGGNAMMLIKVLIAAGHDA